MAVTFDANATADATANSVTSITTSNLTVGSGANRVLVVQVAWSGSTTSQTVTWDNGGTNQAMALIPSATVTNTVMLSLYGLAAPTSGAKQLRAAWTTARDICINGVSWTGADQTGGSTSFPNGTSASGTSSTLTTVTVTSVSGNAVMAVHATAAAAFSSVNNTQTFLDTSPANMSAAGNRGAGAATVTLTGSMFGSSGAWGSAGTDIAVAGTVVKPTGPFVTSRPDLP